MKYKVYHPHRHKGISYAIVYLNNQKELDKHIFYDDDRKKLEQIYGVNIVFITDDEYLVSGMANGQKSPFDDVQLINLPFHEVIV